jgi:ferredoxin
VSEIITRADIVRLIDEWIGQGRLAAGPRRVKRDLVGYSRLERGSDLLLDGFQRPWNSIKEYVFPRHERLYSFRFRNGRPELTDAEPPNTPQLVVGSRPCDAAALPILDHVFNWDYRDEFYNRRRAATTVVTIACATHDEACFCTSVGLGPDDPRGSDVVLADCGDGTYEVRAITQKGRELVAGRTQASDRVAAAAAGPDPAFRPKAVLAYLARNFESAEWERLTASCLGCGACAYTCPTCHCFDIVDEGTAMSGARVKNWDSCQFPLFTLHASGHNPRTVQPQRQRQRIYHKFSIYPEKFGELLCTGCGSCARQCPVGLGVLGVLKAIEEGDGEHLQA